MTLGNPKREAKRPSELVRLCLMRRVSAKCRGCRITLQLARPISALGQHFPPFLCSWQSFLLWFCPCYPVLPRAFPLFRRPTAAASLKVPRAGCLQHPKSCWFWMRWTKKAVAQAFRALPALAERQLDRMIDLLASPVRFGRVWVAYAMMWHSACWGCQ